MSNAISHLLRTVLWVCHAAANAASVAVRRVRISNILLAMHANLFSYFVGKLFVIVPVAVNSGRDLLRDTGTESHSGSCADIVVAVVRWHYHYHARASILDSETDNDDHEHC